MAKRYWDIHTDKVSRRSDRWASSDRGWYFEQGRETSLGHYLDYGPDHFRSSHEWCGDHCTCRESQPGNVHAVSCVTSRSRYFLTVEQAQRWIETEAGDVPTERPAPQPWKVRRIKWNGEPAELLTFTGTTEEQYDQFLDARFADGREPIGFRRDAGAPARFLVDASGGKGVQLRWMQFRRYVVNQPATV